MFLCDLSDLLCVLCGQKLLTAQNATKSLRTLRKPPPKILVPDYVKSRVGVQSRNSTRTRRENTWSFCVSLLPLFPLDVVLFPGTPLPLHIFEPRYREMIAECLDRKKSFGVVRAKEEGVAEIGCTAEIITVTKKYPDGRLDIVTEGRERFEVIQVTQERSFLQAEVLYLQDEPGKATPEEIALAVKLQGEIAATGRSQYFTTRRRLTLRTSLSI